MLSGSVQWKNLAKTYFEQVTSAPPWLSLGIRFTTHGKDYKILCYDGYRSFRYKFIHSRCKQFLLLGLKSKDIHPKYFFHSQTTLEVNKMFVQFHCLSLYQNDRFPLQLASHLLFFGSTLVLRRNVYYKFLNYNCRSRSLIHLAKALFFVYF